MTTETLSLEGGKYEFIREDGSLLCKRHGAPWRSFGGDKAVNALFDEALAGQRGVVGRPTGNPELDALITTNSPQFNAVCDTLPPNYWARYDLSAARLGWELARRETQKDRPIPLTGEDLAMRHQGSFPSPATQPFVGDFLPAIGAIERAIILLEEQMAECVKAQSYGAIFPEGDIASLREVLLWLRLSGPAKQMKPHQLRVVDEKAELDDRREKLRRFRRSAAFNTLPYEEQELLTAQACLMLMLSGVLGSRIERFAEVKP